jgi:hypothetical protein
MEVREALVGGLDLVCQLICCKRGHAQRRPYTYE